MKIINSVFLALWLFINFVSADVIKNYHVDITVLEDGKIDVIETIAMDIDHEDIRLGIIRDIPEYYSLYKKLVHTPVNILSVTRNGKPENYWIERRNNKAEVFTGAKEDLPQNYIPLGENIYVIHWMSPNHIRGFVDYDELYLNAIGNDWEFPIEKASVILHLPDSVKEIQSAAYYGKSGSTKKASVEVISPQLIKFTSPQIIGDYSGLTIATGFTKDVIPSVNLSPSIKILEKIVSYFPSFVKPIHIVLMALVVVLFIWWCFSFILQKIKLPKNQRAFMVRFTPPNMPLDKMIALRDSKMAKFDRLISAFLVDLVQKKHIIFQESTKFIVANPIVDQNGLKDLTSGEQAFILGLQKKVGYQVSYGTYSEFLYVAFRRMIKPIEQYISQYYSSNMKFVGWIAFLLFVLWVVISCSIMGSQTMLLMLFPTIGCGVFWIGLINFFNKPILRGFFSKIFILAFCVLFSAGFSIAPWMILFGNFNNETNIQATLLGIIIIILFYIVLSLYVKMKKSIKPEYVDEQQQVLEFIHFLRYTKSEEYKILTPELFEKYLPYAIAFDIDSHWVKLYQTLFPQEYILSGDKGTLGARVVISSSQFRKTIYPPASNSSRSSSGGSRGGRGSGSGGGGSSGGGSGGGGGRGR